MTAPISTEISVSLTCWPTRGMMIAQLSTTHDASNQGFGASSTARTGPIPPLSTPVLPGRPHVDATARPQAHATARAEDAGSAEIRLDGVSKVYPDGTVGVAELDLTFAAGELSVLVGPSGCGK